MASNGKEGLFPLSLHQWVIFLSWSLNKCYPGSAQNSALSTFFQIIMTTNLHLTLMSSCRFLTSSFEGFFSSTCQQFFRKPVARSFMAIQHMQFPAKIIGEFMDFFQSSSAWPVFLPFGLALCIPTRQIYKRNQGISLWNTMKWSNNLESWNSNKGLAVIFSMLMQALAIVLFIKFVTLANRNTKLSSRVGYVDRFIRLFVDSSEYDLMNVTSAP